MSNIIPCGKPASSIIGLSVNSEIIPNKVQVSVTSIYIKVQQFKPVVFSVILLVKESDFQHLIAQCS